VHSSVSRYDLQLAVIALPLAWLTARVDLWGRRIFTVLGVLPLAVPGYVMAYGLLAATGQGGTVSRLLGFTVPQTGGYAGSLLALSFYTYPYLFLNLRAALLGMDASLEETARSLGYGRFQTFYRVVLPQLRPAFLAGGLLVGLHVLGDFGVVSLMRYETFSYAIYLQYAAAYDRVYAAWLALMLLVLTSSVLILESRVLRGLRFDRPDPGSSRLAALVGPGAWTVPAYGFLIAVSLLAVGLPVGTVLYWMGESVRTGWMDLAGSLWDSVSASAPAALLASAIALPLAYVGVRSPSRVSKSLERFAYLGYAIPPLAFALGWIFLSVHLVPWFYQTLGLLILAYALHFLAEAIGPIRSALYQTPPALEEAARSLGRSRLGAFLAATFPLLKRGFLVSTAFVFLSAMKELPITFLLSPIGFEPLAVRVWSYAEEALFAEAAPYALTIIVFSAGFVGLLLSEEETSRS
jgi:iron(III) transport system permease protein